MIIINEIHDISNLMTRLQIYATKCDVERVKTCSFMIRESMHRLTEILKEGNVFGDLEVIDIGSKNATPAHDVSMYEKVYDIKILIDTTECGSDVKWYAVPNLINTVYSNMLQNAAKAGATTLWVDYIAKEYTVELLFRDNGHGMSKKDLDTIGFTSNADKGSGVWLIRDIVNSARGVCKWDSIPNVGTQLTITLKRYRG